MLFFFGLFIIYFTEDTLCCFKGNECCYNYFMDENGNCSECATGWIGINCNESCMQGYYGKLCSTPCNCVATDCDFVQGCPSISSDSRWSTSTIDDSFYYLTGILCFFIVLAVGFIFRYRNYSSSWFKERGVFVPDQSQREDPVSTATDISLDNSLTGQTDVNQDVISNRDTEEQQSYNVMSLRVQGINVTMHNTDFDDAYCEMNLGVASPGCRNITLIEDVNSPYSLVKSELY